MAQYECSCDCHRNEQLESDIWTCEKDCYARYKVCCERTYRQMTGQD